VIAVGAVSVAAAVVAGLFVANDRAAAPRLAPPAPYHGCALPVTRPEAAV
jgi:hypothetical protein